MYIAIAFLLQVVVVVAAAAVAGARVVMELIKFKKTLQVSYFLLKFALAVKLKHRAPLITRISSIGTLCSLEVGIS